MSQIITQITNENTTTRTCENHCYITIDGYEYKFQNTGLYINFLQEFDMSGKDVELEIKDNTVVGYLRNSKIFEAKVYQLAKYGIFIKIKNEKLKGLVHKTGLLNDKDCYKIGQNINVREVGISVKDNKTRLLFCEVGVF